MEIISYWNKRPLKTVKNTHGRKGAEYIKVPVHIPYGQKMAMVIITDKHGRKQTRHMLVEAPLR